MFDNECQSKSKELEIKVCIKAQLNELGRAKRRYIPLDDARSLVNRLLIHINFGIAKSVKTYVGHFSVNSRLGLVD